jgi:hypothetical protein
VTRFSPDIPKGSSVMTNTSVTLQETGIADAINGSGQYDSARNKLHADLAHRRRRAPRWLRRSDVDRVVGRMTPEAGDSVSFETDVKPLFRERDRGSMQSHFDLWSYDDVSEHADAILDCVQTGTMPCDGAWPKAQVDLFRRWVESGKPK